MGIPRRLGRLARGFVSSLQEDERLRESLNDYVRENRRRSETLKDAFGAAWRGASEEWRASEERRLREESGGEPGPERSTNRTGARRDFSATFAQVKYSPEVLAAYERLDLLPGASLPEVDRRRREMVKKFHPDRFTDPDKRVRAERVTAEINAAHDLIERRVLKKNR